MRKIVFIFSIAAASLFFIAFAISSVKANAVENRSIAPEFHFAVAELNIPLPNVFAQDSSAVLHTDSTGIDSTAKNTVAVDTAFLKEHFPFQRKDSPAASPFQSSTFPFILKTPQTVQREVKLDSTGQFVIVRETIGGKDIRIPVKVPVDEYIKMRAQNDLAKNLEELIIKEDPSKKKKNDLGDLLGSFTNIDIPVPANPVFSIFGPPRINLVISGAVDIRAAFRNTQTDVQSNNPYASNRNEPDFSQEVQINVSGTIGDKLNILADWNTQRTFEYENQLRIKYTGYEDEIVQSVEAGNVSLATNSSFVNSSSALFGIKAGFQVGPLKLTAIASQKKGQIQEKTVTGGSQEVPFEKRAWEYSKDHFFVDTAYIQYYEPLVRNRQIVDLRQQQLQIKDNEFEVYISYKNTQKTNQKFGYAFLELPPVGISDTMYQYLRNPKREINDSKLFSKGDWEKLEPIKDYKINQTAGYISLNRTVQEGFAIAIAYRIENGPGNADDICYGTQQKDLGQADTLILKLIKPETLQPDNKLAWALQLRNIYPMGGRKIQKTGFELKIVYREAGKVDAENIGDKKWVQVFGLDRYMADGKLGDNGIGDGVFDYDPFWTIDEDRGEIIFPRLQPFGVGLTNAFKELNISDSDTLYRFDTLYTGLAQYAQNNTEKDKFYIIGKTTASSSNTINLGFNVVEGSVQVLLDGTPLTANVDYTVDYIIGQVIIKNQAALVPGANLQIKFEQNDLFQLASKTLLGLRGEVDVSERTKFGFTIMNLNQQTLSDKVRLNEEPMNNTIFGFDGQTGSDLDFLTKALDALPLLDTKANSEFTLRGEAAYMNPDPNTKKSPIPQDAGQGIAYIDDFEGAKRIIPLGVSYGMWRDMSPPRFQANVDIGKLNYKPDTLKMWSKAKAYWFNYYNTVTVLDIYGYDASGNPVKSVAKGNEFVQVLNVAFNPQKRGQYNYSPNLSQTLGDPTKNWGGIQRTISTSAVDLVRENIGYIELWVKIEKGNITPNSKVYIDLGAISEDIIPNGLLDTEDGIISGYKNGILNEGEDVGMDGLNDAQERAKYATFIDSNKAAFPEIVNDPAGDNFVSLTDILSVNGTEGNLKSDIGRYPDSEDMNRNNVLDRRNDYFEYELALDTTSSNPQRIGGGWKGWYQYRIPINSYKDSIGSPNFSTIEFVRLWFTGFDSEVEVRIADFNLIGNQWEPANRKTIDSSFSISVVNIEDNSRQGYTSPSSGLRERDRTKPDEEVYGNEQSLALIVKDLKDGQSKEAVKRFTYKALDVFSYREMKMFVHGDFHFKTTAATASAKTFIRFGNDSLNYYEYRAPVYPGWDPRNEVRIIFSDLTSLKQGRDSSNAVVTRSVPNGPDSATYSILGNPSLRNITYISLGIENPSTTGETSINGQVWFNELRLANVDDTPGWAYSVSSSVKLADVGSISFSYAVTDPYFHRLEERLGSRQTNKSWSLQSSFALERFFPQEWNGTSFPFSYSHSENISSPLYLPSSDILVSKAADLQRDILPEKRRQLELLNQQIANFVITTPADSVQYKKLLEARKQLEKLVNTTPEQIINEVQSVSITDTYAVPSFRFVMPYDFWLIQNFFNRITYGFSYTSSFQRNPQTEFRTSWQWNANLGYSYQMAPDNYFQPFIFFEGIPFLGDLKNTQLYYLPITNISTRFSMVRSRANEKFRSQEKENPVVRGLSSTRGMAFGWKLTENGLLNLSGDYAVDITSTLVHLELAPGGRQRDFGEILGQMFMKGQLINFGLDNSYGQTFSVNTKPRVPTFFDLQKFITLSARYQVGYRWQNNLQQGSLGIATGWSNSISLGTDIGLKQFVETWWPARSAASQSPTPQLPAPSRGRANRDDEDEEQSSPSATPQQNAGADTAIAKKSGIGKDGLIEIARALIKTPLLDYDKINISFTQSNSSQNPGVPGRPGFANLFGRAPFVQNGDPDFGPTRSYQLGLVTVPSANITDVEWQGKFPFIKFKTDAYKQLRAPNAANLNDAFSQSNKITLRTSRDLWTGAKVDLNWNLGWDYSKTKNQKTDSLGRVTLVSSASSGAIERSFFTLPPTAVFSIFRSGMEDVGKKYTSLVSNPTDKRTADQKLSQAFEEGFETLPIFKKIFGDLMPRVNYSLRWDGLEQFALFKNFATRVSLDHAYNSNYRRAFKIDGTTGMQNTDAQRISYGFAPLLGMNIAFKEILKGTMSANLRYSSTVSYDLTPTAKSIIEGATREFSLTASFGRSGFEIPLFGLALQNDIDISFSYSYAKNNRTTYNATNESLNTKGTPGEGSSTTSMEPRVRYVLSSRVTASLFYRYRKIEPDAGGSKIPGQTTNEGGVDVHIAIQ